MSIESKRPTIAIAGASGFIGKQLIPELLNHGDIHALSRRGGPPQDDTNAKKRLEWVSCDLFSLTDCIDAVQGADIAIYLVHSMLPSARLTQGSFHDIDLILADNFARACAKANIRHIIYLSGLVPESTGLSLHLESRIEVESALAAYGAKVTVLRAGMIVGRGGSSFRILDRLVRRLPWMVCPAWTQSQMQPIDISDVVRLISYCVQNQEVRGQVYDIGGPDIYSYRDLIIQVGKVHDKHIRILDFPAVAPALSVLWVCLITRTPRALVAPLVQSLEHDMIAGDTRLQDQLGSPPVGFEDATRKALAKPNQDSDLRSRWTRPQVRSVRSIQRLPMPHSRDAEWLTHEYLRWLPSVAWPMVSIRVDEHLTCEFRLKWSNTLLLRLEKSTRNLSSSRIVLRITGGILARTDRLPEGRLEFRTVRSGEIGIAAIHDFRPRLPWFVYNCTQALAHSWVMNRFRIHLTRKRL